MPFLVKHAVGWYFNRHTVANSVNNLDPHKGVWSYLTHDFDGRSGKVALVRCSFHIEQTTTGIVSIAEMT